MLRLSLENVFWPALETGALDTVGALSCREFVVGALGLTGVAVLDETVPGETSTEESPPSRRISVEREEGKTIGARSTEKAAAQHSNAGEMPSERDQCDQSNVTCRGVDGHPTNVDRSLRHRPLRCRWEGVYKIIVRHGGPLLQHSVIARRRPTDGRL